MKFNLGCGNNILPGHVNVDSAPLPGVDVVHDLLSRPWPIADSVADEVIMFHVLEHIPDTIGTLEEIWRISRPGGLTRIRVPYFNSPAMFDDPTHTRFFTHRTLNFFDPRTRQCQERPYYSTARFEVEISAAYCRVFGIYLPVRQRVLQRPLLWFAEHLPGLVWVIEFELTAV